MKTQTSLKGCESNSELEGRVKALTARVGEVLPDAQFAKFSLESTAASHAVGLIVALGGGSTLVRHGSGPDWDRAFMELERRLDRLDETS